jgi:hypothetical protein
VADVTRRHPGSVRRALEVGDLHGTQRVPRGRWTVRLECAQSWAAGAECVHRANVTSLSAGNVRAGSPRSKL